MDFIAPHLDGDLHPDRDGDHRQAIEIEFAGSARQPIPDGLSQAGQIAVLEIRQRLQRVLRIKRSSIDCLRGSQRGRQIDAAFA